MILDLGEGDFDPRSNLGRPATALGQETNYSKARIDHNLSLKSFLHLYFMQDSKDKNMSEGQSGLKMKG